MLIRHAKPTDNGPLVQLAALTPMDGSIGLRVLRHPDFFGLLRERGDYTVWAAEDIDGSIVGSFSTTKIAVRIQGTPQSIHYLGDLRIHPRFRGSNLAFRLVRRLYDQLMQEQADLLFCTAADGNSAVMDFFTGRAGIPAFRQVATFFVHQLLPRHIRMAPRQDPPHLPELTEFYEDFYRAYTFYPAIGHLASCVHFSAGKFPHIKAAISVYDSSRLRQNEITHYPIATALALEGLRLLRPMLRLPPIPRKGETLRVLYAKYLGFVPGAENELHDLLMQVKQYAYENGFHLVSVAADAKDLPLGKIIRPHSRFVFRSIGLMTSLQGHAPLIADIAQGILYEDFSLV